MNTNKNKNRKVVIKYHELGAIIAVFLIILFLLFPEKRLLGEFGDGADLLMHYRVVKQRVFLHPEGSRERNKVFLEVRKLLEKIVMQEGDEKTLETLYEEALQMASPDIALEISEKLVNKKTGNQKIYWLKEAYKQSLATSNYLKAERHLTNLLEVDRENRAFWLSKLVEVALPKGEYEKISQIYIKAMQESEKKGDRREFFLKALKILQAGNLIRNAMSLAEKYEDEFIHDNEVIKYLLKLYLAGNDQQKARRLALKKSSIDT